MFLSHPSVFVVASVASVLFVLKYSKQFSISFWHLFLLIVFWVFSFSANYFFFLRWASANEILMNFWQDGFLPLPISIGAVKTWYYTATRFLSFSGFPLEWHVFVFVLIALAMGYDIRRRPAPLLLMALCVVYALCASMLGRYPFLDRMTLFAVPLLILCAVIGLQIISKGRSLLVCSILAVTLVSPCITRLPAAFIPIQKEEVKPLIAYLDLNRQPSDHVYVYYGASHAVKYYSRNTELDNNFWHFGKAARQDRSAYLIDINAMRQWHRVWFVFAHAYQDEENFFISHIDGSLVEKHAEYGASLYLYDFRHAGSNK
jgi:hypothetical protein